MGEPINVRVQDGDRARLLEIARSVGALAPSGLAQGQPSISRLLIKIANGELTVCRKEGEGR